MAFDKTPKITPYVRSALPAMTGNDRLATDNELKKLEITIRDLTIALKDAQARIAALEAKLP